VARITTYLNNRKSSPADEITRLQMAAGVLDQLSGNFTSEKAYEAAAEKMYRALVSKQPRRTPVLVFFLARHGRPQEALDLGERAGVNCPAEALGYAIVTGLHGRSVDKSMFQRAEAWLAKALAQKPGSAALQNCLAECRNWQGRYKEAIDLYRDVIARHPDSAVALNNLAWLLAVAEGKHIEALGLIERASRVAGPLPELRATRAVIYMGMGKGVQAIADLKQSLEEKPQLQANYFHLAQAYVLLSNREQAKEVLRKAGLGTEQLHPLERKAYEKLVNDLRPQ
jgi:tetratricopeptide (TPR) repeat protein